MFQGFESRWVRTSDAEIAVWHAGSGPPVLLLHGYPQTHVMWHLVAPLLADHFTVIVPDLRGYGDSSKPRGDADHYAYSKRALARDQVELMSALGHERFAVVGHDRGARVAHRLALDEPDRVTRLVLLDILPTRTLFLKVDRPIGLGIYHWFFLAQPYDLPERLIGADPEFWLRWQLRKWSGDRDDFFDAKAVAEYVRCFRDPDAIHASCEDYRAGATVDLEHDESDLDRRITCPLLVLWGERAKATSPFDVLGEWGERAARVYGRPLDSGHFLAEERPSEVTAELFAFLGPEAPADMGKPDSR
ncbi:alpha/beta hydrolase [Streptomyces sp. NPDC051976]|uniref:alpha/beta fold hydrolase n=1 Tax=Streptomyces sp. NPDC051976 TaxID=3154947 RepID=UPI0034235BD0